MHDDNGRHDDRQRGRSRRALIAGASGALGALAAATLAISPPAQAAQGQAVIEGADNTGATSRTAVFTAGNFEWGFLADPNSSGKGSLGVYGHGQDIGVLGDTSTGTGVSGVTSGPGEYGVSGDATDSSAGIGVIGSGASAGVWGQGAAVGVHGISTGGSGTGVVGIGETAVLGTGTNIGIRGETDSGDGTGVEGVAAHAGTGVIGTSDTGYGIFASTNSGVALVSDGPARFLGATLFSRSGSATITYPAKSVTMPVPGGLTSASLALAPPQNTVQGVWVVSALPNTSAGKLTITLNKAPGSASSPKTIKVAWFVVN